MDNNFAYMLQNQDIVIAELKEALDKLMRSPVNPRMAEHGYVQTRFTDNAKDEISGFLYITMSDRVRYVAWSMNHVLNQSEALSGLPREEVARPEFAQIALQDAETYRQRFIEEAK